ncbi:hypothetical protein ACHAWF_011471 [Thalassiosira exigua]
MSAPESTRHTRANERRKTPCICTLLCSLVLTAFFIALGVIFLAFPTAARHLLYPCLSGIQDKTAPSSAPGVLEGDVLRLAGACLLSIAASSFGLLVPLLPCCNYAKDRDGAYLGNYFFLRTILFMQASMGLALVVIGLVNYGNSEDTHIYEGRHRCSSLKDQTILWMGVGIVSLTSFGLMSTFWPTATVVETEESQHRTRCCCRRQRRTTPTDDSQSRTRCCCRKHRRTSPTPAENMEPLLSNEDGEEVISNQEGADIDGNDRESGVDGGVEEGRYSHDENEERSTPPQQTTSRLRGTARLLKLAGRESLYLWVGIAVLLVRLPFSLTIPHFVSTTIASLINGDFDGAKREVLLLFLLGTVDAMLDFWCIFLFGKAKENIVRAVRVDTFSSILRQEQAFFDQTNTGELVSRLTSDCGEMAGDLTWFFRFSVEAIVRITGISVYMVLRSPTLGLCTLAIVPFVGILNKFYGDWLSKNAAGVQNALAAATTCAHESLACIKTVITLASEDHEREKYKIQIEKLYDLNIQQLIATGIYFMLVSTWLINTIVQASLLLLGTIFVEQEKLSPEVLLAFMLYQGQLQEYTLNLFQSYSSLIKSSGAGDRVFYLLDRHPPPPGKGNLIVKSFESDDCEAPTNENIAIENLSFSYPTRPDALVLNKISLQIESGGVVALVGHSGCGSESKYLCNQQFYWKNLIF